MTAFADVVNKAREHLLALDRVRHFRMELDCVESPRFVSHAGNRTGIAAGDDLESGRQFGDLVTVAHPHVKQAVAFFV